MSAIVEATRGKVQKYLTESLGSVSVDQDGDFGIPYGSTVAFVSVNDAFGEHAVVDVWAIVLRDVPLTPELFRFVANKDYRFGDLIVRRNENGLGRVIFSQGILGDFLDPEELRLAVSAVAVTADELDDEMQARFGGRKFIEE